MDYSKLKYIGLIVGVLILIFIGVYFLVFRNTPSSSKYPASVQKAINNPVQKNGDWSTLDSSGDYQISYGTDDKSDTFFITINASPVESVAQKAEQALIQKLGVDKDEACKLPVIINVTASVAPNLAGINFGPSFCPNVPHLQDIKPQPTAPREKDPGA